MHSITEAALTISEIMARGFDVEWEPLAAAAARFDSADTPEQRARFVGIQPKPDFEDPFAGLPNCFGQTCLSYHHVARKLAEGVLQSADWMEEKLDCGFAMELALRLPPLIVDEMHRLVGVEVAPVAVTTDGPERLSARELANRFDRDYEALRRRLDRWRSDHDAGWYELPNRAKGEPRILYDPEAVERVIADAPKRELTAPAAGAVRAPSKNLSA